MEKGKILVEFGEGRRIAKLLGCTEKTVSLALNDKRETALWERIRKIAILRGGILKSK
jgi:predicted transcriptional regulator